MSDSLAEIEFPVVSLGTSCLARWMIHEVGVRQPTYPFDDVFGSIATVTDCLEDDFSIFMDWTDYLPGVNHHSWVPRRYDEEFGQTELFAHHDMRLVENQAKFARRVERFRKLREQPVVLFVIVAPKAIAPVYQLRRLAAVLLQQNEGFRLLAIRLGDGGLTIDEENLTLRNFNPRHPTMNGLHFPFPEDNAATCEIICQAISTTRERNRVPSELREAG